MIAASQGLESIDANMDGEELKSETVYGGWIGILAHHQPYLSASMSWLTNQACH